MEIQSINSNININNTQAKAGSVQSKESARKAGLPINRSTLLDYIKNDGASNPLLEAMNRNKENVANIAKKSNYEKLDKEADQLTTIRLIIDIPNSHGYDTNRKQEEKICFGK